MAFTRKMATWDDLTEAAKVEAAAMKNVYLEDAWDYYARTGGELVCIYEGEKMVGIGRLSVLFDGSGWLECLRVAPEYQNQGAGKLIYKEWLEIAHKLGCQGLGMFTSDDNARSAGLAEKYGGLTFSGYHQGYTLTNPQGGDPHGFKHVNWERAEQLILPLKEKYNDYMSLNRTFYRVNSGNAHGFASSGWVYEDTESGSFVVAGARFQHMAALHIAAMGGDLDKCIDFAINLGRAMGNQRITCTVAEPNEKLVAALTSRGFTKDPFRIMTKEVMWEK